MRSMPQRGALARLFFVSAIALASTGFATAQADEQTVAQASPSPAPMTASPAPENPNNPFDGKVHTTLVPYVWLPNINGTLRFTLPNSDPIKYVDIKAGPNDYLSNLHFATQLIAEVRKGEWSAYGDLMYLNISSSTGSVVDVSGRNGQFVVPITLNATAQITSTLWELEGSRTLMHGTSGFLDVNAGARGIYATNRANWNLSLANDLLSASGSVSQNATIVDAILGLHGRLNLGSSRWSVPYYFDYGWGDNNTTAQQWLGVGYSAKHGQTLNLVYRNIAYYMSGNGPFQTFRMGGPAIGYGFRI